MEKLQLSYVECLRKIFTWNVYRHVGPAATARSELNLNKMLALSAQFGNPHLSIPCVHIAGTNGKGTVTIKTAAALQKMNLKTGMFISPHISTFRERITINNEMITEEQVVNYSQQVFEKIKNHGLEVTFFEIVTMIAFLQFRDQKVDVAVLECGLGGRLDATNIC